MKRRYLGVLFVFSTALLVGRHKFYKYLPSTEPDRIIVGNEEKIIGPITKIKVYKAKRYLDLMHNNQVVRRYSIKLGFNPIGPKEIEGDGKTPEGIYKIDWRNPRSKFYKSLHVSYPNEKNIKYANEIGKNAGGNIMIHGSALIKIQFLYHYMPREDWTLGCIAVSNAAMDEIWQLVKDGTTVEIAP